MASVKYHLHDRGRRNKISLCSPSMQSKIHSVILGLLLYLLFSQFILTSNSRVVNLDNENSNLEREHFAIQERGARIERIETAEIVRSVMDANPEVERGRPHAENNLISYEKAIQKEQRASGEYEMSKLLRSSKEVISLKNSIMNTPGDKLRKSLGEKERTFHEKIKEFVSAKKSSRDLRKRLLDRLDTLSNLAGERSAQKKKHTKKQDDEEVSISEDEIAKHPYSFLAGYNRTNDTINKYDFKYLISCDAVCRPKNGTYVHTLIFIEAAPKELEQRRLIRKTWGSVKYVGRDRVETIYVVGKSPDPLVQQVINAESKTYGDILQIDFQDSYHNLTLKTILALKWATEHCPQVKFIMKTDLGDTYITVPNLVKYLNSLPAEQQNKLFAGNCKHKSKVIRPGGDKESYYAKFEVSYKEYPFLKYHDYCSGGGYVLSNNAAKVVVEQAHYVKFFRLEDVYVGLCAYRGKVNVQFAPGFNNNEWAFYTQCRSKYHVMSTYHTKEEIEYMWKFPLDKPLDKNCPSREDLDDYPEYDDKEVAEIIKRRKETASKVQRLRSLLKQI